MKGFDYSDLRFVFEHGIPWARIGEARGQTEDWSGEYLMTLDNAARFCRDKVAPRAALADEEECRLEADETGKKRVRLPRSILEGLEQLKGIGAFCGMTFPEEHGGLGFPLTVSFGLGEVLSMGDSSLGLTPMLQEGVGQVLLEFADEKVTQAYLPKLVSGERICSMGLTEPAAGSDLANMRTVAVPADGRAGGRQARVRELEQLGKVYLLNGTKIFITNGFGDVLALARTAEGISTFLVSAEDKEVPRIEKKLGIRGSATCEVLFEDSPGILIGEPGRGLVPNMLKLMHIARVGVACQSLGIAQRAHALAFDYATRDRVQFGVPIAAHGPVRKILFENELQLQATRALTYLASAYFDLKESTRLTMRSLDPQGPAAPELKSRLARYARIVDLLVPMCKYDAAELANQVAYSSLQVFGGYGFTREYPLERLYRDVRITSIYEGTSQIQLREVFNGAYSTEKIGLLNQLKCGGGRTFVETDRNRLFVDLLLDELAGEIRSLGGSAPWLQGVQEMRACLRRAREECFLQEQKRAREAGKSYLSLYQREFVDLLGLSFKALALMRQALASPAKIAAAGAFVERAVPLAEYLESRIRRGTDDLITDGYEAVMHMAQAVA
ncbi:MAG: acyl-CoA dehydrogenase family protein [bacterium]